MLLNYEGREVIERFLMPEEQKKEYSNLVKPDSS